VSHDFFLPTHERIMIDALEERRAAE